VKGDTASSRSDCCLRRRLAHVAAWFTLGLVLQSAALAQTVLPLSPPTWTGSVAAGLSVTRGNSDTLLFTMTGRADKKWDQNELSLGAAASYGEDNGDKNNDSQSAFVQYNRLFTDRWYAFTRAEGLHDQIADVEYRVTLSVGLGYYFIKTTNTLLSVEAGPGYVFERVGNDNNEYATLRLAEKFEHKFSGTARVWEMVEYLPGLDSFDNYVVNGEVGVESALTKTWSLRLVLQDTYDNEPAPGKEKNDMKLIGSIAWKF